MASGASAGGGHAKDFRGRCDSGLAFGNRVLEHGGRSIAFGSTHKRFGIRFGANQLTDVIAYVQGFKHSGSSAIPGPATMLTADRFADPITDFQAKQVVAGIGRQPFWSDARFSLAAVAQDADQP